MSSNGISSWSIRNPIPVVLLFIVLTIAGVMSYFNLRTNNFPDVDLPVVVVSVVQAGAAPTELETQVTRLVEDSVSGLGRVKHITSTVNDSVSTTSIEFELGVDLEKATNDVRNAIAGIRQELPADVQEPIVQRFEFTQQPIATYTVSAPGMSPEELSWFVDNTVTKRLLSINGVSQISRDGGVSREIRIKLDPARLEAQGVTAAAVSNQLRANNINLPGGRGAVGGEEQAIRTVGSATSIEALRETLIPVGARTVRLGDLGEVVDEWSEPRGRARFNGSEVVGFSISRSIGSSELDVYEATMAEIEALDAERDDLTIEQVTNTTSDVINNFHASVEALLLGAGLAVLVVFLFLRDWRATLIAAVAMPMSLIPTFWIMDLMGQSLNVVTLLALSLTIGILVDDAIVIVENIVRHWHMRGTKDLVSSAVEAVAEVGNPTIIATLTIIVALLPMMFVSGMMGPYMSPIPANASFAMIFSFFVAVIITPWLLFHIARRRFESSGAAGAGEGHDGDSALARLYLRVATPVLSGRRNSKRLLIAVGVATLAVCLLFVTRDVAVKLLPFDNKSELQVVLDMPHGTTLEDTQRVLFAAADKLKGIPELTSIQLYAGTSAPFNFNGLVRHYYLRSGPQQGDLQVNFVSKDERSRASHDLAIAVRTELASLPLPEGAVLRVVEVPPGPPVLATLLAEIYGPDEATRRAAARKVEEAFRSIDFVQDVDTTFYAPAPRQRFLIDQDKLEFHGVEQQVVYDTIATVIGGAEIGYSQRGHGARPYNIVVKLPRSALSIGEHILSTPIPAGGTVREGKNVELGDVVTVVPEPGSYALYRRDGRPAEMVLAEVAGRFEAPIYGMFAVENAIKEMDWGEAGPPDIRYHGQPTDESRVTLLWDGEWEVTYVTFRDMGAAFGVAILGIYLLVVAQFGSFKLPLVILIPVPLTLIGIVLGHWAFGAAFTATSMIGFIALAGIIVRNSILLVDFIQHRRAHGDALRDALLEAGAIRFKPIALTAAAAIIGAVFIIADPIFQGLALSLVFGLASSTALTLLVIPAVYILLRDDNRGFEHRGDRSKENGAA